MKKKKEPHVKLPIEKCEVIYLQLTLLKVIRILSHNLESEEQSLCDSCYWLSRILDATLED